MILSFKPIVCDAGPLIGLTKINQLSLLTKLFETVFLSSVVLEECVANPLLPGAQSIQHAVDKGIIFVKETAFHNSLEKSFSTLDPGEKSAILLAKELDAFLLIDEKKGRAAAMNLSLKVIGVPGLLLNGYKKGLLNDLKECLQDLQKNGYRLSDRLIEDVIKRAYIS